MNTRIAVGSGLIVFLVGAIFWAGATYNRMGNMEVALGEIKVALVALNKVPLLEMRITTLESEIKQLEEDKYEKALTPEGKN